MSEPILHGPLPARLASLSKRELYEAIAELRREDALHFSPSTLARLGWVREALRRAW